MYKALSSPLNAVGIQLKCHLVIVYERQILHHIHWVLRCGNQDVFINEIRKFRCLWEILF